MPQSTTQRINDIRKQLAHDGCRDPYALAAEALERVERLEHQLQNLQAKVIS